MKSEFIWNSGVSNPFLLLRLRGLSWLPVFFFQDISLYLFTLTLLLSVSQRSLSPVIELCANIIQTSASLVKALLSIFFFFSLPGTLIHTTWGTSCFQNKITFFSSVAEGVKMQRLYLWTSRIVIRHPSLWTVDKYSALMFYGFKFLYIFKCVEIEVSEYGAYQPRMSEPGNSCLCLWTEVTAAFSTSLYMRGCCPNTKAKSRWI